MNSRTAWDDRFTALEDMYGEGPNLFLKAFLQERQPGRLFLPGEGEGRNAVYAARQGWEVTACDFSAVGRAHALARAARAGVSIDYLLADLAAITLPQERYDVVASIFCHLPSQVRGAFHRACLASLVAGGFFILEAFSKEQLPRDSGGPKDLDLLCSVDELREDFGDYEIISLSGEEVVLDEGAKHRGAALVIRLVARKPE